MRHSRPLPRQTARTPMNRGQVFLFGTVLFALLVGLVVIRHIVGLILVATSMAFTLSSLGLLVAAWIGSIRSQLPRYEVLTAGDPDLPAYSVLLPLYKEGNMLPSLVASIEQLDYPKDRLQVLILLEEKDEETQAEAIGLDMPGYFDVCVVPTDYVGKQGKPRALNYGLERITGAFTTIYDAEDRPDPDQLLKAVAAFRALPPKVACLQARLHFWNRNTNWVTWMYWMEYVIHFDWVLPGLAKFGFVLPLGGTSNHLRTEALRNINGWDSYNVTEDADLAAALAMRGYKVQMLDSTTNEEATAKVRIAIGQRRRWLKGYAFCGFVHTRRPIRTMRRMGPLKWFAYVLLMFSAPVNSVLSLLYWGLTIDYLATQSQLIERLFPLVLFYIGLTLMIAGNIVFFLQLVFACMKRDGLAGVRYTLCALPWIFIRGYTACLVVIELCRPSKWHEWIKTEHGHDLHKEVHHPVRLDAPDLSPELDPA